MALKKATKEQSKLRLAIYGLSGGGKTYSALSIAEGLVDVFGGKIAVLDTEFRSASKYANIFNFETDDFGEPTIENYLAFIEMCKADPNITVLVIDSLTHAWQWCLMEVDRLTKGSSKGDNRNAWRIVSPKYDKLVNAIITAPFHVIGTMRAKTEWSSAKDNENKASHRDTLAPVQREGFEYEFDMLMEINANHFGAIIKDRSGKFQDEIIEKPGFALGVKLAEWLKDGEAPKVNKPERQTVIDKIAEIMKATTPDGTDFFTIEEKNGVKESIVKTKETEGLKEILAKSEKELEKRRSEYKPIPFGDEPTQTANQKDEFTDDIPWDDKEKPSLKEDFFKAVQGKPVEQEIF